MLSRLLLFTHSTSKFTCAADDLTCWNLIVRRRVRVLHSEANSPVSQSPPSDQGLHAGKDSLALLHSNEQYTCLDVVLCYVRVIC